LIDQFPSQLEGCGLTVTKRQSATRLSHDAETEDILDIFELLDNMGVLCNVQFVAVAHDKLPRCKPEDVRC